MAGEPFYLPNYGAQPQGLNLGLGNFGQTPQFTLPNYGMEGVLSPGSMSLTNPAQMRYGQISQQMQPNPTLGYIGAGIQGVSTLGNLFLGWKAMQQAAEASKWQQGMAEKNYANSVASYNTAMADKVSSRYAGTPGAAAEVDKRKIGGQ